MKDFIVVLFIAATPMICFLGATFLAYKKRQGWGWLIFAGIMAIGTMNIHVK